MSSDDLSSRLARLYAAIGATTEADLKKVPARTVQTSRVIIVTQDFSGGMSPADMQNAAASLIANIAGFRNHLMAFAGRNGRDKEDVNAAVRSSMPIRLMIDLWNDDKHPGGRGTGQSGKSPRLTNVSRSLQLRTPEGGGSAIVQMGPGGALHPRGGGTATVQLSGDVLDGQGEKIGDLYRIAAEAIRDWERLLAKWGIERAT